MPLIRTYMHNSGKIAFRRAIDVCVKQCLRLGLIRITLEKLPLEGLLRCMHALLHFCCEFWYWNSLYHIHLFSTAISWICQWLLNNDRLIRGEGKERLCEINCPSLGFHAILSMKDTSLVERTHSRNWTKGKGSCKINCPSLGFYGVPSL